MWNLYERVLGVEELRESHEGAHMTKLLRAVLVDYNLIDKVRIFYVSLLFCTKYCVITTNNASNNRTIATSLEFFLKGSSSRFTKNYLTSCMTHVINLLIQCGLKELGNDKSYLDSEDDDKHIEGLSHWSKNCW